MCLLAILLNPTPPPLVCIEEPELGLHPDLVVRVADLLKEASTRMQLVVTTHSDMLLDALSDTPESIVVCSKEEGETVMTRLDAEEMRPYLEEHGLSHWWNSGTLGGRRW
jgi:predicted ATPase